MTSKARCNEDSCFSVAGEGCVSKQRWLRMQRQSSSAPCLNLCSCIEQRLYQLEEGGNAGGEERHPHQCLHALWLGSQLCPGRAALHVLQCSHGRLVTHGRSLLHGHSLSHNYIIYRGDEGERRIPTSGCTHSDWGPSSARTGQLSTASVARAGPLRRTGCLVHI